MAKNIGSTFGDILGNIYKGALSSLEGIWDFGAGIVGEVGGIFDKDFKKDVRAHIEYDWAGDTMTPWLDDLEKQSYIKEGSIVRDIASGVGGMLPAVATTVLTGGLGAPVAVASAAGTGVTMVGAAGQGTQESMKNGAGYDSALAYGTASGIVEGLTERLGGYTLGGGTSVLGKKIAGTSFGNAVSKGVGKFAFDAVSEGAEEVLADIADPTLKYLTGVDKNIGKNYVDTIKGLPKTFVTGAAVGSVMQGGSNVVSSIKNSQRGGIRATRADNAVQNILEVTKNYKENDANNYKYDKAVKTNLETMSSELVMMKPEARKTYLDSVGVYKNAFDSKTGKLKDNLVADTNRRAISANLRTISGTLTHKPLSGAETITQGAEKAKKTVERVVGTDATVVVTNELKADEKATFNPHDGVIYINNKADLTDEDIAKAVALHEVTHTTEGTKAYAKLVEQIESVINDENAPKSVKKIVGDIYKRQLSTASAYESEMESLNKAQTKYLVDTEVNADLIGDLLSDENFLDILANRDDGLLKKLYNSFTKRASIKKSELGPDGIKYLKKLASKFGKAIDKRAGGVKLSQLGGDEKKEETIPDERKSKIVQKSDKKITIGMSDAERTKILKDKSIVMPVYKAGEADKLIGDEKENLESGKIKLIKAALERIATQFNAYGEYNVKDIKVKVDFSKGNLDETAKKSASHTQIAKLLPVLKDTVENAIGIERHENRYYYDNSTVAFDNLIGAYKDGKYIIPVRFGLKCDRNGTIVLYVIIDQNKIEAKVVKTTTPIKSESTVSRLASKISISQIAPFVNNKDILRYFPDDMLNKQQKALKWEGIAETIEYTNNKNDKKYFKFIKAGNLQAAKQMVKQAASVNGYTIEGFHGTRYTFTEFSKEERGKNTHTKASDKMFFAADEATAKSYHPYSVIEILQGKEAAEKLKNKGNLYHLFIKMKKPLIVDVADYDYVAHREKADAWMEFVEQAERDGNDGIILLNALDNQLKTSARESTVYMFRESSQAKLAETIVYDENDNIVPISKRFDDKNKDIRYSKNRLYDPKNDKDFTMEEVPGGVKVNFNDFDTTKSNDNSNDLEVAERARKDSMDALLNSEPPKKEAVYIDNSFLRRVTNNTKAKKFTRKDVKNIVDELLSQDGYFGDNFVHLKGKQRAEAERMLWHELNSKNEGELGDVALNIADYIIRNTIATEYLEVTEDVQLAAQFVDAIKPYLHNMNLEAIKGDIKAKFDDNNSPYLMWAVRKNSDFRGYTADEVKQELEALGLGFAFEKTSEADIFFEIDNLYKLAKQVIIDATPSKQTLLTAIGTDEAKKLKQKLAKDIVDAQYTKGTETSFYKLQQKYIDKIAKLGNEVKQAHKRNTLNNRILKEAKKISDSNKHTFANATEAQTDALKNIKSLLSRINSREQVNRTSMREIMKEFSLWYNQENPVLGYIDEQHPGFFSKQIAELTRYFGEVDSTEQTTKKEKPLSLDELESVNVILHHMNHIFENYGKIWRGGKYVEAADVVKTHYEVLEDAENNVPSFERMFLQNKYVRFFMDPMSVLATWDGHDPNGYFTTTYKDLVEGLINQRYDEMQALRELDEFRNDKKNKAYMKALTNGNDKIKIGGRIDPRKGTIEEIEVPKYIAIDLYMVSKTGQAIETLEETGYCIKLDGEHTQERMNSITRGQLEEMFNNFSEQDKKLISIMERAYNGICREMKYDTDMRRLGYSNVFEGYYYPINRINATDFDTNDFFAMMDRVSASSFNKSRVHSKNAIVVSNALSKFLRHVNGVTKYKNLSIPIENMGIVFNLDISGDKHMPTSLKMKLQENDLWKGAEEYMKRLVNDVQNVGLNLDGGSKAIAWLRGSYAKFQLGANPKVWFSQLSSYLSAYGELRISSLTQAPTIKGAIKDSEVDKYCHLAAVRHYDKAATKAQAVTDKAGNVLTAPIEAVDRGVVKMLFAACQAEAKARFKLEIGTEENKIKAGEILTNVILRSQQNQLVTEQSGAMRSTSEIIKSLTMFNSDSMKQLSRLIQSLGEILTLKNKIKSAKASGDSALVKKLTAQKKQADTTLRKYCAAIVSVAVYMALLVKLFKWLYNKDDEEQPIQEWLFKEAAGNIVGMAPLIRDAYSFFNDGFEADIFVTSMANDVLKAFETTKNLFVSWVNGKDVAQEQLYSNIRSLTYSLGQLVGLPTRNIYNFTTGIIRRLDEGTGKTIDSFFRAPSENDAKESLVEGIEKNNERLIDYSLNAMYKKYSIDTQDKVLKGEMDRLIKLNASKDSEDDSNYNPLSFKIPEILEIDGEEVELSAEDRKLFKNKLNLAHKSSGQVVRTLMYKRMSDASKAYAIRKVYQYYDLLSRAELTGTMEKLVYFGDAVGVDILAQIMAYKYELNNATDDEKSKRTKSTKELITEYLSKFNLTLVQKSLVLRALGYNDKTNDALVRTFINRRYNLTSEQKAEFMQYASIAS